MKKVYILLLIACCLLSACKLKLAQDDNSAEKPLVEIQRYDRLEYRYLTTGDFSALQEMSTEYPVETRTLLEDVLQLGDATDSEINRKFLNFYQATKLQSLIADVETQYANIDDLNNDLNNAFLRLKKSFPDMKVPMVYAQISALDQSIIVGDMSVGISLDKYLGEDYPLYKEYYPESQRKQMSREYILPDCLSFYLLSVYPMKNFELRKQIERDLYMGKVQWIVNQVLGRKAFGSRYVKAVETYMHHHPKVSFVELLKMTDFSVFNVAD